MRTLRPVVCACFVAAILVGTLAVASGGVQPARAATVESPDNYAIDVECTPANEGGSHCAFLSSVAGGDLPVLSIVVPAEALCGDIVDTNLVAGDGGSMVAETDWATIDFADDVIADNDQPVTYVFTVGDSDDDTTTVEVPGAGLQCATAPAAIGLAVRSVRGDDHGIVLFDACYALYQVQGDDDRSPLADSTCDGDDEETDGVVHFGDIPADSTLAVVETQTPAGYLQAAEQIVDTAELSLIVNVDHEPIVAAMTEVLVLGLSCDADPGEIDPQQLMNLDLPAGCLPGEAVLYDVTVDGQPVPEGVLTADMYGSTQTSVSSGSQVVITMLANSGPPGYTTQENPIVLDNVQGELVTVVFLSLRDADPSPSPEPSTSPAPSPDVSPSPSPATSSSPQPSPSASISPSPAPSASPAAGASVGPASSPATDAGPSDPGQTAGTSGDHPVTAGDAGTTQVTELPATGSLPRQRGDRERSLILLVLALGAIWLGWRIQHRRSRP